MTHILRRYALYIGVLLLVSSSASAETGEPQPQRARLLLPAGCPELPFDQVDLISTLRVELLGQGTELRNTGEVEFEDEVVLIVDTPTCTGIGVVIRIEDPVPGHRRERRLDISDRHRPERGRILALALAELLDEAWPELLGDPREEPRPEPAAPETVDELRQLAIDGAIRELDQREEEARRSIQTVMLEAGLVVRSFPMVQGGQLGGQLGLSILLSRGVPVRLVFDIGYGHGGGTSDIGDVRVQTALGGIALMLSNRSSHIRGVIGPRVELGWGWAEGLPSGPGIDADEVDDFLLSVSLAGGGRFRLSSRVWITLDGQVGWYASALEPLVEGRSLGGVARALVSLAIGISVGL